MKFPLLKIIIFGCSYTAIEEVITSDLKHIDFRRYVDMVVLNRKQTPLGFNQIIPESLIIIKLDYLKKKSERKYQTFRRLQSHDRQNADCEGIETNQLEWMNL